MGDAALGDMKPLLLIVFLLLCPALAEELPARHYDAGDDTVAALHRADASAHPSAERAWLCGS
jgi:hypothetical protein